MLLSLSTASTKYFVSNVVIYLFVRTRGKFATRDDIFKSVELVCGDTSVDAASRLEVMQIVEEVSKILFTNCVMI